MNLTDWAASVANRYIDIDGAYGNQCWDLSQSWLFNICGPDATLWTQPSSWPGMAAGCWEVANSDAWPGPTLRQYVTPIPGDQPGQPGDVIIWNHGARLYPISHTAVLLQDQGANLYTISQNSSRGRPDMPGYSPETTGPAIYQFLPREGIAGFLRPNILTGQSSTITPIQEDELAFTIGELLNSPAFDGGPTISEALKEILTKGTAVNDAIFNGGKSMKYGVSLQSLIDDIPRRVVQWPVLRDGKQIPLIQEVADAKTNTIAISSELKTNTPPKA